MSSKTSGGFRLDHELESFFSVVRNKFPQKCSQKMKKPYKQGLFRSTWSAPGEIHEHACLLS